MDQVGGELVQALRLALSLADQLQPGCVVERAVVVGQTGQRGGDRGEPDIPPPLIRVFDEFPDDERSQKSCSPDKMRNRAQRGVRLVKSLASLVGTRWRRSVR